MEFAFASALSIPSPASSPPVRRLRLFKPHPRPSLVVLAAFATPVSILSLALALFFFFSFLALSAVPLIQDAELENKKHALLREVQDTQRGLVTTADQRASIQEALVLVSLFFFFSSWFVVNSSWLGGNGCRSRLKPMVLALPSTWRSWMALGAWITAPLLMSSCSSRLPTAFPSCRCGIWFSFCSFDSIGIWLVVQLWAGLCVGWSNFPEVWMPG